ncbi:MAG: hypothetical protein Q8J65_07465 [Nitrosomonadales bacterium]|nr:hypothetical protein [Nitrosomonadales bacterium]
MLHRLILTLALTFLLGFSQQSALLHEISHLADISPLSEQQDQAPQHATNCEHCLSFSHLAYSVNSDHTFSIGPHGTAKPAVFAGSHHQPFTAQAYTARAPPTLI